MVINHSTDKPFYFNSLLIILYTDIFLKIRVNIVYIICQSKKKYYIYPYRKVCIDTNKQDFLLQVCVFTIRCQIHLRHTNTKIATIHEIYRPLGEFH